MSKKKAGGKTSQHIRPSGKRLGIKANDGKKVTPGMIIVRQRGLTIGLGKGVARGRDFTIYSISKGKVKYSLKLGKKIVSVL